MNPIFLSCLAGAAFAPIAAAACDLPHLTDAVDRLKASSGPVAFQIAAACVAVIERPDDPSALARFSEVYRAAYSSQPDALAALAGCGARDLHNAG